MADSTFVLAAGKSIQLNLQVLDADGNHLIDPSGNPTGLQEAPLYAASPSGLVTLTSNPTGVLVTYGAPGAVVITVNGADVNGTALQPGESDGQLSPPLAVRLVLVPA